MSGKRADGRDAADQAGALEQAIGELEKLIGEAADAQAPADGPTESEQDDDLPVLLDVVEPDVEPKSSEDAPGPDPSPGPGDYVQLIEELRTLVGEGFAKISEDTRALVEQTVQRELRSALGEPRAAPAPAVEPMDKTYEPHGLEQRWYARWEARGWFRPSGSGPPYCIMLPPPNVTGSLHMGHAFQDTLMDALIRYHRMRGDDTLWQCGTDHAGIATQMVVERALAEQGIARRDLGREDFIARVWAWKETSGGTITEQLRRLGCSMDWSRERFTLDEDLSRAVTEVFVRLYEEGLVYRGKRLVNWDPVLHTAISDLEVVSREEAGHLWHIRYPLAGGSGHLVVATTRPETMLGDTAVAVHPEDERYRALAGREVALPLTGRTIPIVADAHVDPAFGSGCVKITPAHDFSDYAVAERHGLPMLNIFTDSAALNDNAPAPYRGLDRFAARKRVVADLEAEGLIERIDDHRLTIPRGDRSGAVVEPYLTDQWFVRIAPLAKPAIEAVATGRIRFVPENWAKTYFEWMRNIQDWCISRQLWWGHRIPAWYDDAGRIYVGRSEQDVRNRAELADEVRLRQDPDVLDTWFSSALWPFSTLGWPDRTPDLQTYYPTSVLVTGFDIIFFWVARMIMMGLKFVGDVPFREVYIHGLVRDADGHKMSKSRGNILDPLDLIDGIGLPALLEKRTGNLMRPADAPRIAEATRKQFPDGIPAYGADALRFTFASLATQGRDVRFDLGRIEGYRNFCNKIWNAARYVTMAAAEERLDVGARSSGGGLAERWIEARLQQTIAAVTEAFSAYRFDLAAQAIYDFFWNEYCDWYLELSKVALNDPDAPGAARRATRRTLLAVLEQSLRLAHPLMPFITEELWQRIAPLALCQGETISLQPYPVAHGAGIDAGAIAEIEWLKGFVMGVRRIRAERNISPGKPLPVFTRGGTRTEIAWLERNRGWIEQLARVSSIRPAGGEVEHAAAALAGEMTLLIPLAELIDREAELARLDREIESKERELARTATKLRNRDFVERAPAEVVERERGRFEELKSAVDRLREQRLVIEGIA